MKTDLIQQEITSMKKKNIFSTVESYPLCNKQLVCPGHWN